MWGSVNPEYKRRLNIISFIVLPVLMLVGLVIGAWLAKMLNFRIDSTAIILASSGAIPLYLICIRAMYVKAKDMSPEEETKDK